MANGPFRQMVDGAVMLNDQTAVTGTTEVALWPVGSFSGFGQNQLRAGQKWKLTAYGVGTTPGSSQGNITLTPRFGTSAAGTALGASVATALVASATTLPWELEYNLTIRSVGNPGANSNCIGYGIFTAAVGLVAAPIVFGSTASVAIDLSVASGLYVGVTLGSASDSFKTLDVILESLN